MTAAFLLWHPMRGAYYRVTLAGTRATGQRTYSTEIDVKAVAAEAGPGLATDAVQVPRRTGQVSGGQAEPGAGRLTAWEEDLVHASETDLAVDALHGQIRRQEEELYGDMAARGVLRAALERGPAMRPRASLPRARRRLPEQRVFRLYDREDGADRCSVDRTVNAHLIAENDHLGVYEEETTSSPVTLANVQRTIDFYSAHGAEVIERYFGGVSDVDGDGRVLVLVDPALDGIRAYVWSGDMTFAASDCATSNETELIHVSAGAFEQFEDDRYWVLASLVHEMKHVSSLYKRVRGWYYRGAQTGDQIFHPTWIEEGRAEIAKEMSSRLSWERDGGPPLNVRVGRDMIRDGLSNSRPEVWGVFGLMARVVRAFSPRPNAVTFEPNDQGHIYGSGWHFHRLLRDYLGNAAASPESDERFVTALNDSLTPPRTAGLTAVTDLSMADLLTAHAVAISVAGSEEWISDPTTPRFTSFGFPRRDRDFLQPGPCGALPVARYHDRHRRQCCGDGRTVIPNQGLEKVLDGQRRDRPRLPSR